jgi:transposase-like protein
VSEQTDTKGMTLPELMSLFDTKEECRAYLEELRWPDGVRCPRCGSESISRIKARSQFDCDGCRYQFSTTSGTIFHDSHLPLPKWFAAIYLMCQAKKGMSALQLKRTLGMSYKTAWYMCHRVRAALKNACGTAPLRGTVEVDETYIGGVRKNRTGDRAGFNARANKMMILGATSRRGGIRLKAGRTPTKKAIQAFVDEYVDPSAHMMTDQWHAYKKIGATREAHGVVMHSRKQWKKGTAHTNTIEGAFSLFKRSVVGSYHHLSVKHLPAYLDEFEFRYSNRDNPFLFRDTLLCLLAEKHVTYKTLTA